MPRINNLPNATTLDLSDKVLGVVGGLAKNMTLTQLKSLIGTTVEDSLASDSATNAVSVRQAKLLSDALVDKCPLVDGKVPSANLPSYVDDVLEYPNFASFPVTGEAGKIYVDISTDFVYRWSGSTYAATSGSLALGETASTAYRGDRGKTAYDHSQVTTGNPHGTAISDITGLQTALDAKATVTQAKAEYLTIACSDESTALTAGTGKITFRMPYAMTLTSVRASLSTAQTSGNIFTVDINESGTSILSTKLTIDNSEKTSTTAAAAPVISDSSLADDAEITIDIDQIGDGTAKGLKVTLIGTRV